MWNCDMRQRVRVKNVHLVQAGVHTRVAVGNQWTILLVSPPSPFCCRSEPAFVGSSQQNSGFPQPSCQFYRPRGARLPCVRPKTGMPDVWLKLVTPKGRSLPVSSPFSSQPPPGGTGPDPVALCPFLTDYTCIFSQPWLCRSPSARLQLVFSENCSSRRGIFGAFVEGGELCVLLLHHLDPSPGYILILTKKADLHLV